MPTTSHLLLDHIKAAPLKHLKSKVTTFLLSFFLVFISLCPSIFASLETRVFDDACLLTVNEEINLAKSIKELKDNYPLDIAIVTTPLNHGKTPLENANNFYDEHGLGYGDTYSGILLLIDMSSRNIAISTDGEIKAYFSDQRIDMMLDRIAEFLANKQYNNAANCFLQDIKTSIDGGINDSTFFANGGFSQSTVDKDIGGTIGTIIVALFILFFFTKFILTLISVAKNGPQNINSQNQYFNNNTSYTPQRSSFFGISSHNYGPYSRPRRRHNSSQFRSNNNSYSHPVNSNHSTTNNNHSMNTGYTHANNSGSMNTGHSHGGGNHPTNTGHSHGGGSRSF